MNKIIIFDMDGVLIDSIPALYQAYLDFLKQFGKEGTPEEFDTLNGPKLSEIIDYLKKTYDLEEEKSDLLSRYRACVRQVNRFDLMPGVKDVLEMLRARGCTLALASSSSRNRINNAVQDNNLSHFFEFIVSGDEVERAKPHPEIYQKVAEHFGKNDYYVVEDATHGTHAALAAGMRVVHFTKNPVDDDRVMPAHTMQEVGNVLRRVLSEGKVIAMAKNINVSIVDHAIELTEHQQKEVDRIWDEKKQACPRIFNGSVLAYLNHTVKNGALSVNVFRTEYKFFVAQDVAPELELPVCALGVSGIIFDEKKQISMGRRMNTTFCRDWFEVMPAGNLNVEGDSIDPKAVIKEEFHEETGIDVARITELTPLGLVLDTSTNTYDVCYAINISGTLDADTIKTDEYHSFRVLSFQDAQKLQNTLFVIPTTQAIFKIIERGS